MSIAKVVCHDDMFFLVKASTGWCEIPGLRSGTLEQFKDNAQIDLSFASVWRNQRHWPEIEEGELFHLIGAGDSIPCVVGDGGKLWLFRGYLTKLNKIISHGELSEDLQFVVYENVHIVEYEGLNPLKQLEPEILRLTGVM